MSTQEHKKAPVLPGENPTVEERRINTAYLGQTYALTRSTPNYMPNSERQLNDWLRQYISTAQANRMNFPTVFNTGVPYSVFALAAIMDRIDEAHKSLDILPGTLRAVTAFKNILYFNRATGPLAAPRPETGWIPPTDAVHTGIVSMIAAQVELLRRQPGFNEVLARQFGILPTPAPHPDLATVDPEATARFDGGEVILNFRSPRRIRGVDVVQILCDRGNGHIELVGTTTHTRFVDAHELPPAGQRATWWYYICYLSPSGTRLGIQSDVSVTVQGSVGL